MDENINDHGVQEYTPTLSSRIENFFYHYKWHTIAVIITLIIVTVIGVQMCSKESYDAYVLYAGGHSVSRKEDTDVAEYVKITSAIARASEDFNGDGEILSTLLDLYTPTPEEVETSGKDNLAGFTLENVNTLEYELVSGSDYYLCFISEYNYNKYKTWDGVLLFTTLSPYIRDGSSVEYYDESAVYLSSTAFSDLDGISSLPPDTLVCLRALSPVASFFDKDENEEMFRRAEVIIKNILNYGEK